jgi:hypothetical protein
MNRPVNDIVHPSQAGEVALGSRGHPAIDLRRRGILRPSCRIGQAAAAAAAAEHNRDIGRELFPTAFRIDYDSSISTIFRLVPSICATS